MNIVRPFTDKILEEHLRVLNKYHKTQRAAARTIGITPKAYNRWFKKKARPNPMATKIIRMEVRRIKNEIRRIKDNGEDPRLAE